MGTERVAQRRVEGRLRDALQADQDNVSVELLLGWVLVENLDGRKGIAETGEKRTLSDAMLASNKPFEFEAMLGLWKLKIIYR